MVKENARFHGAIGQMAEPLIPAALEAQNRPGDLVDNAVRANVQRVVDRLKHAGPTLLGPLERSRSSRAASRSSASVTTSTTATWISAWAE